MSGLLAHEYPDVWGPVLQPIGPRTAEEMAALRSGAAFAVVPSVWDGFNLAAAEAMAAERAVIVSRGAGAADLVTDGVDGLLFPAGDAAALADVLARAVAMPPAVRREMGRRARRRVQHELDPDAVARRRAAAYAEAIERGPGIGRRGVNEWVRAAVRPGPPGAAALGFLDQVALRDLAAHARGRLLGGVRRRMGALVARTRGADRPASGPR